jgi:hypothetical protein
MSDSAEVGNSHIGDTIVLELPAESSSANAIFCATPFSVIRILRLLG